MANTPRYVRLVERLNRGIVADIENGSGWSIAGLDVKEVPDAVEEPVAHEFVKNALRVGKLEAAEDSEYAAVQKANETISEAGRFDPAAGESVNEGAIQTAAVKARRELAQSIPSDSEDEEPAVPNPEETSDTPETPHTEETPDETPDTGEVAAVRTTGRGARSPR